MQTDGLAVRAQARCPFLEGVVRSDDADVQGPGAAAPQCTAIGQPIGLASRQVALACLADDHVVCPRYLRGAGLVTITAQLEPQNLERAEAEVLAEIQRVRDRGVTVDELRRGVTAAEVDHEFSTETAEGRARAYGQAETIWRLQEELIYLDRLRTVSAAQVQSVARRYLDPTRYVRVALVPPRS